MHALREEAASSARLRRQILDVEQFWWSAAEIDSVLVGGDDVRFTMSIEDALIEVNEAVQRVTPIRNFSCGFSNAVCKQSRSNVTYGVGFDGQMLAAASRTILFRNSGTALL
jgi:hypothetical protein